LPDLPRPVVLVISGHALKDPAAQPAAAEPGLDVDPAAGPLAVVEAARRRFRAASG
jgi:hypothetical protein